MLKGAFPFFSRSRNPLGLVFIVVVSFVGALFLPTGLIPNPFFPQHEQVVVDVVPLLACLGWSFMAYSPMREMEGSVGGSTMVRLRLTWWVLAGVASVFGGMLGYLLRDASPWLLIASHARNTLIAMALATLFCLILPQAASWIPLALYAGVCWIAGTIDELGTPRFWALPCYLINSWVAALITLTLVIPTVALYCRYEKSSHK